MTRPDDGEARRDRDAGYADATVGSAAPPSMPSPLEKRYRRLLRLLPAGYRAVREEEMVDAFVQAAIEEDPELADATLVLGRPGWSESLSVVRLALRLRLVDPYRPRRYHVLTAGLHMATLGALAVLAVIAALGLAGRLWVLISPPPGVDPASVYPLPGADPDPWTLIREWAFVVWIPCLVLAASGRRTGARWAAWLAAIPVVATAAMTVAGPVTPSISAAGLLLVLVQGAVVLGLASMASADEGRQRHGARWWLCAASAGLLAVAVTTMAVILSPRSGVLVVVGYLMADTVSLWCGAAVVAAGIMVVRRLRGLEARSATLIALTLLGAAATLLRAGSLPAWAQVARSAGNAPLLSSAVTQFVLVFAITVTAGILAMRRVRALPTYGSVGPAFTGD